jgi:5'-3' exoribonuclease 2
MNQQRSRRFRAAQEAKVKEEEKQALIEEYTQLGKELPEDYKTDKKAWDSNAITPGTPFMTLLTESLRYWIVYKMNTDKGWSQVRRFLHAV